jgi:hypothetical protein
MSEVTISEQAARQLRLLARAWDTDEAGVVDQLLDRFMGPDRPEPEPDPPGPGERTVSVRALYEGVWTEGVFEIDSRRLTITSGELKGRTFKSPSGAAREVVRSLNPGIHPNRNGWMFWTVATNGQLLESVRH